MADRAPLDYPVFQAFDANGDPLVKGQVEFFDAGTTNQRDTYSDPGLTTANPNPVTLNSRGEPESGGGTPINIYLDNQPYKIVLKDSDNVTIRTVDNYIDSSPITVPQDPADAADQTTDVYEVSLSRDPEKGEVFTVDFTSTNTTTTPTLENTGGSLGALTIKTRDGSALWAGALSGVHELQLASGGTAWLVLDPNETIDSDITVSIPSDFATLQDAVDVLSHLRCTDNARIILNIETGHALTQGLDIRHGDYGHFRIESADALVSLAAGFTGPSESGLIGGVASDTDHLIMGFHAVMPVLACRIDMGNSGGDGYYAVAGCRGYIDSVSASNGVINAGRHGLHARSSQVDALSSDWSGATEAGARIIGAAVVQLQGASCDNCSVTSGGELGAISVRRGSVCNAQGASAINSGHHGVSAARSQVSIEEGDVSGAAASGIRATSNSFISAKQASIDNCDTGVNVIEGSMLAIYLASITGSTNDGIEISGSTVDASSSTVTGSGGRGVHMGYGYLYLIAADISGSGSAQDILIGTGASIVHMTNCTTTGGTPSIADVGGISSFNSTESRGIIFSD